MKNIELPNTLSGLLEIALADLIQAENTPGYVVQMEHWHKPDITKSVCAVCLAGAVIAFTLEADPEDYIVPSRLPQLTCQKIRALDDLRHGWILSAWSYFYNLPISECTDSGLVELSDKWDLRVVNYKDDTNEFKRQMAEMIDDLKKIGH